MKTIKKIIGLAIVLSFCCGFIENASAQASMDEKIYWAEMPMEAILAQPKDVYNKGLIVEGVLKIEEDGIIVYYSQQDYEFDTKENAIWLPERPEATYKEWLKQNETLTDGQYGSLEIMLTDTENTQPYAATGAFIIKGKEDAVLQKNQGFDARGKYDRKYETQEPERLSYYRLMGDPWRFDGKKVCFTAVYAAEDCLYNNNSRKFVDGLVTRETINGAYFEEKTGTGWHDFVIKSRQYGATEGYEVAASLVIKEIHIEVEGMFYFYNWFDDAKGIHEKIGLPCGYVPFRVDVVEKDREKFIEGIQEAKMH